MSNKIVLKKSSVALKVPLSTDLDVGEIAVNLVDQKLYSKKADGTVVLVGTGISGGTGDVIGAASSTDNAVTRFDGTTGKVIQNSAVIIDDSNNVTGVNSLTATTLIVNDNVTLGSSNSDTVTVNGRITTDVEPNANNAKDIGTSGRNWRDGFFGRNLSTVNLSITGTTEFDGSQGTSGQVLTSSGTGNTPTWTTPSSLIGTTASKTTLGVNAGLNITGNQNTAIGNSAAFSLTSAIESTAIGHQALYSATTANSNTAIGNETLRNTTGGSNTALGHGTGYNLTTGSNNTLLGYRAGMGVTQLSTGTNNIVIGFNSDASSSTVSNETTIGNSSTTSARMFGDLKFLNSYTEVVFAVTGTTPALSPANGTIQTWTLTANSTPTAGTWAEGQSITLMIDDGSAFTVTWTSLAVTWKTDAGVAPTLNTTGFTAITLWKVGSTIYGARVGNA